MTISQRIFALLKEKNLTQKELAEYTGISEAAISGWKTKHTTPSSDKLIKISEFLSVSVYYLLTGTDTVIGNLPEGTALLVDSGTPFLTAEEEKMEEDLLRMFRVLPDLNKGRILGIMEAMVEQLHTDNS